MQSKKSELSDEDLMSLYQTGDSEAFEILYRRHSGRVHGFLQKRLAVNYGREVVNELLQETFLKAHRSRNQYSALYPFLPWIFTIARNNVIDFIRLNESKISANASEKAAVGEIGLMPESEKDDFSDALKSLPENQRRAIELRYLNEWSFEKIAADMKTTPVNVRQVISRGIKKLRTGFGGNSK